MKDQSSNSSSVPVQLPIVQLDTKSRSDDNQSLPPSRRVHLFESMGESYVFATGRSQVFRLDQPTATSLAKVVDLGTDDEVARQLELLGISNLPPLERLEEHPATSFSLAIAQKCNLGCTYCYAQEGDFGGAARNMPIEIAKSSIDQLLQQNPEGSTVNLSFLGGEPLTNRSALQEATNYADAQARKSKVNIRFSLTTNGTLLTPEDADFFERHGFAVTISLDGIGETHDQLRPYKGGRGSYQDVIERVQPLLARQQQMQVSARVTVTPTNLRFRETLDTLIDMGFYSVGFSPMLSSPTGRGEMDPSDLDQMLAQMIDCGQEFERQLIAGKRYPFSNLVTALKEIHQGSHRPYPCGAGAGYFGVSAEGGLYACHRFVEDEVGAMGSVQDGIDESLQRNWLTDRHADFQSPCNQCWARYLCGGGCHHEVIHRGRPACDYIRGWLNYCLQAYTRLIKAVPEYFGNSHAPIH